MINWNEILNEVIGIIEPEYVPVDYIVMAKYTDSNGIEIVVRGSELETFMTDPKKTLSGEARIIVDVIKIKKSMIMEIVHFFDDLNSRTSS